MNELIKITENNGRRAVSARELHEFLESKQDFSTWIKNRIEKYDLVENVDYIAAPQIYGPANGGHSTRIEYVLSVDAAKELSMVEGNRKGKQARKYFLEIEKSWKEQQKSLTQLDILAQSIAVLQEQERRLRDVEENQKSIEEKVAVIEAKTRTRPDYFTVVGYAMLNEIDVNIKLASSIGRKAASLCKKRGIPTEEIPDPRFGRVKTYPESILREVFDQPLTRSVVKF